VPRSLSKNLRIFASRFTNIIKLSSPLPVFPKPYPPCLPPPRPKVRYNSSSSNGKFWQVPAALPDPGPKRFPVPHNSPWYATSFLNAPPLVRRSPILPLSSYLASRISTHHFDQQSDSFFLLPTVGQRAPSLRVLLPFLIDLCNIKFISLICQSRPLSFQTILSGISTPSSFCPRLCPPLCPPFHDVFDLGLPLSFLPKGRLALRGCHPELPGSVAVLISTQPDLPSLLSIPA